MKLPSGEGFSVGGITWAGLIALALLCLAVAAGIAWIAMLLISTSSALVRDAESLRLVTQIEAQLLDYQRLAAFADEPIALLERRAVELDLTGSIEEAARHAADDAEAQLIEQTRQDIERYMRRRVELQESGLAVVAIQRQALPLLNGALSGLDDLKDMNRSELNRAYARAQSVGAFFVAAALTCLLLLLMGVAIRHMMLRPILDLRNTIQRFREGESRASADERAPRELSEIARAFNEMSEELDRQRARQLAFIAGVAHDLRNPLTALQYGVDSMKLRWSVQDQEGKHTVSVLARQIDHLSRMVNDLLETCYIEAGELVLASTTFDLRDAVRSVVDLYEPAVSSRLIRADLGEMPTLVHADRMRIEQVIGNLLSNAMKYSSSDSIVEIGVSRDDGTAELAVADSGIGIAQTDIEDIFRPFWRADGLAEQPGTGLGLSVVRKIVLAHGGTIAVESAPGSGSVFRVRIPAACEERSHREAG
jgi:signal transduction histidine kinase